MQGVRVALVRLPQGDGLPLPDYKSEHAAGADLCAAVREQLTLAPLVILAFWIGLYPKPIFDVLRLPSEKIVRAVGGATVEAPALALKAAATEAPRP